MNRTRLLFSKTGRAKYISHLDLMRTFQRVFLRAGVRLRHTEGFNPHPYMNFALPLSVGIESVCELLDFDLMDELDLSPLPALLNKTMPEGIEALKAYEPTKKFSEIKWQRIKGTLVFDEGVRPDTVPGLEALFGGEELIISKKTKKGSADINIIPSIFHLNLIKESRDELSIDAVISAQNPSLNPDNLITAIHHHLPSHAPDFNFFRRIELFNDSHTVYR